MYNGTVRIAFYSRLLWRMTCHFSTVTTSVFKKADTKIIRLIVFFFYSTTSCIEYACITRLNKSCIIQFTPLTVTYRILCALIIIVEQQRHVVLWRTPILVMQTKTVFARIGTMRIQSEREIWFSSHMYVSSEQWVLWLFDTT